MFEMPVSDVVAVATVSLINRSGGCGTWPLTPLTTLKLTPYLNICRGRAMDKNAVDLVNLHVGQVRPPERIEVLLPRVQEDHGMLKPDVVDRIREWAGQGVRVTQIARGLGIARNSVRRYLAG